MSSDSFKNKKLSRRSDLHSLIYFLIFLATEKIPCARSDKSGIKAERIYLSLVAVCNYHNLDYLVPIATEIDELTFKEKPNYGHLVFLLEKTLLERDDRPEREYNWLNIEANISNEVLYEKYDDVDENAALSEVYCPDTKPGKKNKN